MKLNKLFKSSLSKTLGQVFTGKKDREDIMEEVEEQLILSDISMDLVERILDNVRKNTKLSLQKEEFLNVLKEEIKEIFHTIGTAPRALYADSILPVDKLKITDANDEDAEGKKVFMLVGINGSGKTTTAAKIAYRFKEKGKSVLMAAADTFRAAGSSQLSLWGERLDIPVVGAERGTDPGSVVYNSLTAFNNKDYDVLVIDTAGRVQTRDNLMKELEKLTKIVKKFIPEGPTDTLLVVDGTQGQNTLDQAKRFKEFSGISGMVLAKVDGTAKGGTVLNIINEMRIPVKYIGVGETQKDLVPFDVDEFIDSLISEE